MPKPTTVSFEVDLFSSRSLCDFVAPRVNNEQFSKMDSAEAISQTMFMLGHRLDMLTMLNMPRVKKSETNARRFEVSMEVQVEQPHRLWRLAQNEFTRVNEKIIDRTMTTGEQILMVIAAQGVIDCFTDSGLRFGKLPRDITQQGVKFGWVYPDEDGDTRPAHVDLDSGYISVLGDLPDDVFDSSVRRRIETETDHYPTKGNTRFLTPTALKAFRADFGTSDTSDAEAAAPGESLLISSFYPYNDVIDRSSIVDFVMDVRRQQLLTAHIKAGGHWVALGDRDRAALLAHILDKDVLSQPDQYTAYYSDTLPLWLSEVKQAQNICQFKALQRDSLGTHIAFLGDSSLVDITGEVLDQPCTVCGVGGGHLCAKPDPSHKGLGIELGGQVHNSRNLATEGGADDALVRASVAAALILAKLEDTQIVYELGGVKMYVVASDSVDVQVGLWKQRAEHARQQLPESEEQIAALAENDRPR